MTKSRNFATAVHIMTALGFGKTLTSQTLAKSVQTNPGLVRRVLAKRYEGLGPALDSIRFAVNQAFARDDTVLQPGDEVALIPPVSGG